MTIPNKIRNEVRAHLWEEADRLEWSALTAAEKAKHYTMWTETASLGGKLAAFMDPRQVRVYIKDTLLKSYARERLSNPYAVFRVLELPPTVETLETYIKPHGCRLGDGRQIAWSRATEWKATLMALHERSFYRHDLPYAAVLFEAGTRHSDSAARAVVDDAANKLGIARVVWID